MLINHYSMYQPFLLFTAHLVSLHHFDITVCTCTLSKCMLVSTTYCTSLMLLLYISLTVCTMRFCVLSTCYFTAEPMLCGTSVSHQRKTCLIIASDQLTCIATGFGHQSEINIITFCMQKMISDDDYNGWTCSHMSNMWLKSFTAFLLCLM